MIGFTTSIACIILIVVTIGYGIMVNREYQIKEQYQMQEQFSYLQRVYYQSLLGKDETMRRFRHDLKGHFIALQAYCKNREYQELENYLATMEEHSFGKEKVCNTGNYAIDAIIMPFEVQAREQETTMEIKSCSLEKLKVTDFDFCTILYNLLQNSLEATEQIPNTAKRKIITSISRYQKILCITVKNTISEELNISNNHMVSKKGDKRYYGLGAKNIKKIVDKYDGSVNYVCKSGYFIAEIII